MIDGYFIKHSIHIPRTSRVLLPSRRGVAVHSLVYGE